MFFEICPNCFNMVNSDTCPHCGYNQSKAKKYEHVLPPQTILNARYLLGKVLGKGGFGVTYIAKDLVEDKIVAIKECMPEVYSYRDLSNCIYQKDGETAAFNQCKNNFLDEINALRILTENDFVVNVFDYFTENNTEYFVMEYIDGLSLKVIVNSKDTTFSLNDAAIVLFTVGSALMEVHKRGIIHRDISPENIMIARDGTVKLIDFGASKNYFDSSYYRNESIFLKPGFAPPEQYTLDGKQGPWTDVYALAATFYTIVSGKPLIDSTYRVEDDTMKTLEELGCNVSHQISLAVSKALEPDIIDRYGDVGEFLNDMSELINVTESIDNETLNIIGSEKDYEIRHGDHVKPDSRNKVACVRVISGHSAGKEAEIPDYGFISIGRETKGTDICLDDFSHISRYHCLVGYDRVNNRFIVIDKSANGTYYSNGQRMLYNAESYIRPNESFTVCDNGIKIVVKLL